MTTKVCGCTTETCGCCEGIKALTPLSTVDRPGLPALSYRVGTHGAFFETMEARLSTMTVDVRSADGQTTETYTPLRDLTTRDAGDFSIALLDGWATVADVLTFYQERIANEGFLRTATERRSILELARLLGYKLRPGVAATVYLAYTLDEDHSVTPPKPTATTIPKGSRAQSVPGPGELPQSFETSDDLKARSEWNNLQVRTSLPQNITLDTAQQITKVYLNGTALNLKPNDHLLFVFGDEVPQQVLRGVVEATAQAEEKRTEVTLKPVPFLVIATVKLLRAAQATLESRQGADQLRDAVLQVIENLLLDNYPPLNAEDFSHERIYVSLQRGLSAGKPPRAVNEFGTPPDSTAALNDPSVLAAASAVLDKLADLLADESFRKDLACFASQVIKQARPASLQDKRAIKSSMEQNQRILLALEELSKQDNLKTILRSLVSEFLPLLQVAQLHDNLTGLISELLEVAQSSGEPTPNVANEAMAATTNPWVTVLLQAQTSVNQLPKGPSIECEATPAAASIGELVAPLVKPPSLQPASSLALSRTGARVFQPHADTVPQLLTVRQPRLRETLYAAWSNAAVNPSPVNPSSVPLKSIHVLRLVAQPFGYNAPVKMALAKNDDDPNIPYVAQPDGDWKPSEASDERATRLYLDAAYDAILSPGHVVIHQPGARRMAVRVEQALIRPRTAYGFSGKTTQIALSRAWWDPADADAMQAIRNSTVFAQSEELFPAEMPCPDDVQGERIPLNELYDGLLSGRWLIVSGERTDVPDTTGVPASELVMLSAVEQVFDASLPGDKTRTTITLANKLAYSYKRDTVKIYGNVLKATHGETRNETLGNGDGSQSLQSFALKQPPLTFVPAPNPTGVDSTLEVFVNDVRWHQADMLAGLGPKDRKFIAKTDDNDKTTVIFGNGEQGARLPTGMANVTSVYRNGIGQPGNVKAEQISLLQTRPLGVKSVINLLPATGGADKENRDQARENAPLAVMSLDRLVSVQDYADFTRTFAGIGKAAARKLSDSHRQLVHVTIAGADDIPLDETSELYQNLLLVLRTNGDPDLPVTVQRRELVTLVLSAKVRLAQDYQWEPVVMQIRATLLDNFCFQKRALGQPVLLSEIISVIQNTLGVAYVDVDAFGGIPEMKIGRDGTRRLLTLDEMSIAAVEIATPASAVWFFTAEDFTTNELPALVNKLTGETAPSKFLWKLILKPAQKLLNSNTATPAEKVSVLVMEFNRILLGASISQFFETVPTVPPGIQSLINQNAQGIELIHLNRLLLEAAYPIKRSDTKPSPPSDLQQFVPVNLGDFENGALRPAQLAIFTEAVPDTLILNQIK